MEMGAKTILSKKNPFRIERVTPSLNNKGRMQGYISRMSVCPRFFSETAQLSNMGFAQLIGVVILMTTKLLF